MKKELILEDIYRDLEVKKQVKVVDKIVNVPVKYKTQAIMGLFPISTKKATNFINNKRLKAVELAWGKSLLGITIFNHIVCPVGPYREIAFSIPVIRDAKVMIPFISLLFNNKLKNFGFYSFLFTGSTDIGREHCEEIWNYPFYKKNIDVHLEENKSSFYALAQEKAKNEQVLSLTIMKTKKEKILKRNYQTYFFKNNKLINIELNTVGITGSSTKKSSGRLELGNHEISNILDSLSIDLAPLETIYYREAIKIANVPREI